MKEFTLRELCELCGVSRRAVQGYEKQGFVSAYSRTNRGYLLYDEAACERVKEIHELQNFGFALKEIKDFESADNSEKEKILEAKLEKIKSQKKAFSGRIVRLEKMLKNLRRIEN